MSRSRMRSLPGKSRHRGEASRFARESVGQIRSVGALSSNRCAAQRRHESMLK
jgi:hypothetical protein